MRNRSRGYRSVGTALVLVGAAALACSQPELEFASGEVQVARLPLDEGNGLVANAYLVEDARWLLIDTGGPKASEDLLEGLDLLGVGTDALALMVLTHGHPDHAGGAAAVKERLKAPLLVHEGDRDWVEGGIWDYPPPVTFPEGYLILPLTPPGEYAPATVDVVVAGEEPFDLSPFGVAGSVVPTLTHTPGSVAVVLDNGYAFIGDTMRSDDGEAEQNQPHRHVYSADPEADRAAVRALLDEHDISWFFPGHGGPVAADAMRTFVDD